MVFNHLNVLKVLSRFLYFHRCVFVDKNLYRVITEFLIEYEVELLKNFFLHLTSNESQKVTKVTRKFEI